MQAILLSLDNIPKILNHPDTDIDRRDLQAMAEEYDPGNRQEGPLYFTPKFDNDASSSWGTIPELAFTQTYWADMEKINTEFVDVHRK